MPAEPICSLSLEAQADLPCLERVHDLVDRLWQRVPEVETDDRHRFETAVVEVAGNIVEHGGDGVRLQLRLDAHADRVEAHFRDTGPPVDLVGVSNRIVEPLDEQGRGIALARAAVDDVDYVRTDGVNRWHVRKVRTASS